MLVFENTPIKNTISDNHAHDQSINIESLNKIKESFHMIVDEVKDYAIFMLDTEGRIQTWNKGGKNLKQYDADEIIGNHFSVFYTADDLKINKPAHELHQAKTLGIYTEVGWRVKKDGSRFWANVTITPLHDHEGSLIGFTKITRDLTKIREIEEALKLANIMLTKSVDERTEQLRESEAQFQIFADSMPQLAWIANPDGSIFWYNKGWYDYTGTSFKEMEGWGWQRVHDPKAVSKIMSEWKKCIETRQPMKMTFQLKGADGKYRWFITRVLPIFNSSGELIKWFGTNTNIDEQIVLQQELQIALQSRDDFLSVASHELKTPLTSLSMLLQLIKRKLSAEKAVLFQSEIDKLNMCLLQSEKLSKLIDELLDLTRIRAGRLNLELAAVDIADLIKNVISRMEVQLNIVKRKIFFNCDETQDYNGNWDSMRIEQVITNLISNSIKYGADKDINVTLEKNAIKDAVKITVEDQGIGMSPELQNRVFERFSRESYDNKIAGLGLGLYITKKIVNAHGGKIELQSELGVKSVFTVTLPIHPNIIKIEDTNAM